MGGRTEGGKGGKAKERKVGREAKEGGRVGKSEGRRVGRDLPVVVLVVVTVAVVLVFSR